MPRRLPVRPAKVFGNFFVLFVLCVMALIYYTYVFIVWAPRAEKDSRVIAMLVVYNFLFFMLLWSFFQTMTTDPGQVPVFWGFHLGDNENKRRRYCLMCNVFKPERCHHCSACNRCVLNMDHHCPWINNCVGFWNRKYFLLLLIYVLLITWFTAITMAYDFYQAIIWGYSNKFFSSNDPELSKKVFIMSSFLLDFLIAILMSKFLKFHIMLASSNKTTIENLDKQDKPFVSPYDIGEQGNMRQIFGSNPMLYPFPIFCGSGKPVGDGIYWPTIQSQQEMAQQSQASSNRNNQAAAQNSNAFPSAGQQNQSNVPMPNRGAAGGSNVQMIGNQPQNMMYMNQQPGSIPGQNNTRNDLNQRIFQNQGRAQQLQQQLQAQQQSQFNAQRAGAQVNAAAFSGANFGNISVSGASASGQGPPRINPASRSGGAQSSGLVHPKKRSQNAPRGQFVR